MPSDLHWSLFESDKLACRAGGGTLRRLRHRSWSWWRWWRWVSTHTGSPAKDVNKQLMIKVNKQLQGLSLSPRGGTPRTGSQCCRPLQPPLVMQRRGRWPISQAASPPTLLLLLLLTSLWNLRDSRWVRGSAQMMDCKIKFHDSLLQNTDWVEQLRWSYLWVGMKMKALLWNDMTLGHTKVSYQERSMKGLRWYAIEHQISSTEPKLPKHLFWLRECVHPKLWQLMAKYGLMRGPCWGNKKGDWNRGGYDQGCCRSHELGTVDLHMGSSPGRWAVTVATYCPKVQSQNCF